MSSDITPFKGRNTASVVPTRLLYRFTKADRVAEIHERTITSFNAVEFMILIDSSLRESQMFHVSRRARNQLSRSSERPSRLPFSVKMSPCLS